MPKDVIFFRNQQSDYNESMGHEALRQQNGAEEQEQEKRSVNNSLAAGKLVGVAN